MADRSVLTPGYLSFTWLRSRTSSTRYPGRSSTAPSALLNDFDTIKAARGHLIEQEDRRYLVSYHPAARFYREDLDEKLREDLEYLKAELTA